MTVCDVNQELGVPRLDSNCDGRSAPDPWSCPGVRIPERIDRRRAGQAGV
jgi:hypothetical protein